jgi:monomeric isocitrate dehydrogenase
LIKILFFYRQIFCDFGEEFEVIDTNGENPLTQIVTEISHVRIDS